MARSKKILGLGSALSAALLATTVGAAYADYAPAAADAVGVGSDTVQNIGNFLADGSAAGDTGYNSAGNTNKVISFDATPDANDRAGFAFQNCGTGAAGQAAPCTVPAGSLNPTVVLRAGVNPWQRPNGSGAGIAALTVDSAHNIDFVRMSRLPKLAEYNAAIARAGVGAIRAIKVSTDNLKVAVPTVSNAPASLTAAQLVGIYQCTTTDWGTVGGTAGQVPQPIIPQAGSGTRGAFLADLKAANGNTDITLGACVITGEENDPSVVNQNANRLAPFSEGRLNLFTAGYFKSPNEIYGTSPRTTVAAGIKLLGGYVDSRGLYLVVRQSDAAGGAAFQPGGTASKVQDLIYSTVPGAVPFAQSDAGQAAITAAGSTATYTVCPAGAVDPGGCP
jgi:ABC-type phosphate transport system substrate-binding protein